MGKVIKLGTIHVDTFTGVKSLSGESAKDLYQTLQKPVGTNYQIPADVTFFMGSVQYNSDTVKAKFEIGYGDDEVNGSAVPPTNAITLISGIPVETADLNYDKSIFILIPEGKYPFVHAVDGYINMNVLGIEE